jgi:diaminopropionate ammonia-lyase
MSMSSRHSLDCWIRPDIGVHLNCTETTRTVVGVVAQEKVLSDISGCPAYQPTPLHSLSGLAKSLGLRQLMVKEEGQRFSLQSFKALGGAYAVACAIKQQTPQSEPPVFCCASDGNHGRSVAYGARHFGARAVVFVHHGVSAARRAAISDLGADVIVVTGTYDDSVAVAEQTARESGWQLIADTISPGSTDARAAEAVANVMRGYTLIAAEACDAATAVKNPDQCPFTHVIVQAGVGGLAAALAGWFADRYGPDAPLMIIVEPSQAACLLASARAGKVTSVEGDLETLMAMLSCGEPSAPAWDILAQHGDAFLTINDADAVTGVRRFAEPMSGDPTLKVGESGAAGLGALLALHQEPALCEKLRLDERASVLLIATEAPTDIEVWNTIMNEGNTQ